MHDNSGVHGLIGKLAEGRIKCSAQEQETLKLRLADFLAKDKHEQQVEIQFDSDPDQEPFLLGESDRNGLIRKELRLSEAQSRRLLNSQGSTKGWLTYHAIKGLTGKGRIRDSKYSNQVKEIRIRDVVNDDEINHERLNGMTLIKALPIICATNDHYQKLAKMLKHLRRPSYAENTLPPCSPRVGKISALARRLRRKK